MLDSRGTTGDFTGNEELSPNTSPSTDNLDPIAGGSELDDEIPF